MKFGMWTKVERTKVFSSGQKFDSW